MINDWFRESETFGWLGLCHQGITIFTITENLGLFYEIQENGQNTVTWKAPLPLLFVKKNIGRIKKIEAWLERRN